MSFANKEHNPTDFAGAQKTTHPLPLRQYLPPQGLSLDEFLTLAIQLTAALFSLHRDGIVAGNLHPDNIFIDPQEGKIIFTPGDREAGAGERKPGLTAPSAPLQSLFYLAPEQTGCSNIAVDLRTDIFSLGLILYEMLTGRVPTEGSTKLEWFYNLMAGSIEPPHRVRDDIPEVVSTIVMKCLAREQGKRYQSAYALKYDLLLCQREWREKGSIDFKLGQQGTGSMFSFSPRFFGREKELECLIGALQRVGSGPGEVVFVAGRAGVGKTSLVRHFGRRLAENKGGTFISGKYQYMHNEVPYQPLVQAFTPLFQKILSLGDEEIALWQDRFVGHLGPNLALLTNLMPYLEQIVGKQPEVEADLSLEVRERFFFGFSELIRLFAGSGSPLVLFLDDLQWANTGSLRLLEYLVEQEIPHFLLIGSYRTDEVPPGHELAASMELMEEKNRRVTVLELSPFTPGEIEDYLMDIFSCSRGEASSLADFLHQRTGGNPLFLKELLQDLHKDMVIIPRSQGGWYWDLGRAEGTPVADDLINFLIQKIEKLPGKCKTLLKAAACFDTNFTAPLLAEITNEPELNVAEYLHTCLWEGLIQEMDPQGFAFVHDRVQQAASLLSTEEEKEVFHYQIGRFLLEEGEGTYQDKLRRDQDSFFTAVMHLNQGRRLLKERGEELRGAKFNLLAGKRAQQISDFSIALNYFRTGLEILGEDGWEKDYPLTYQLSLGYLECLYLCCQYNKGDETYQELLQRVEDREDRIQLHLIAILYATKNDFDARGLEIGLQALRELDCHLPSNPGLFYIARELFKIRRLIKKVGKDRIGNLPPARNEKVKGIVDIITALLPNAYNNKENLQFAFTMKICELTLRYGIFPVSGLGFMMLAAVSIIRLGDFALGISLGKTALDLTEKYGTPREKYIVNFLYGAFYLHWLEHVRQGEDYLERAREASLRSRDFTYAGYNVAFLVIAKHFRGMPLAQLEGELEEYFRLVPKVKDPYLPCFLTIYRQLVLALQGRTYSPETFSNDCFDEEGFIRGDTGYRIREKELFDYYLCKNQVYYLMGYYQQSLPILKRAEKLTKLYFGEVYLAEHAFYYCLTIAASYHAFSPWKKLLYWPLLRKKYRQLKGWARRCPANFRHKALLVEAEIARIRGRAREAARLYDEAINSAGEFGYIQNAAIAGECAARFHFSRKSPLLARGYLQAAYRGYQAWGAKIKTEQLRERYPWLAEEEEGSRAEEKTGAPVLAISPDIIRLVDMETLFRIAQFLTKEVVLEELLKKILEVVLQNAGANKAALFLLEGKQIHMEAMMEKSAGADKTEVLTSLPLEDCHFLPQSVINYTVRTGESLLVNSPEGSIFTADPYLAAHTQISVLCLPIVGSGKMLGVLYLEKSLTAGAFTPERVDILRLLSFQMAISIENAYLYRDLEKSRDQLLRWNQKLEQTVAERTWELQQMNEELALARDTAEAASRAKSDFLAMISHEIRTPVHCIIGLAELLLQTGLDGKQEEYAAGILDSAELLLAVISDLLDLRRIEEGKLALEKVDFSLTEVEKSILTTFTPRASAKGISLESLSDPAIPPILRGDKVRLSQILLNLVGNAVKFTEKGKVTLRSLLEKEGTDTVTLRFEIEDTGIGIPRDAQQQLFQPFYRAKGRTRHRHGTGLGLFICKRLLELMQGEIGFTSTEGKGSLFWFTVPLERGSGEISEDDTGISCPEQRKQEKSCTILVAEDNPINQKLIVAQLEKLGFAADVTGSGREAVAAYSRRPYPVVFLDCQMPVLDGYEAAGIIRRLAADRGERPGIIATTASALPGEREKCLAAGMDDLLTKPIRLKELQEILESWLPEGRRRDLPADSVASREAGHSIIDSFAARFVEEGRRQEFRDVVGDDAAFLLELIEAYLADLPAKIETLQEALRRRDANSLGRLAHGMKSSSYLLGFTGFAALCQDLEESAAGGCIDGELVEKIIDAYRHLENELKTFLLDIGKV